MKQFEMLWAIRSLARAELSSRRPTTVDTTQDGNPVVSDSKKPKPPAYGDQPAPPMQQRPPPRQQQGPPSDQQQSAPRYQRQPEQSQRQSGYGLQPGHGRPIQPPPRYGQPGPPQLGHGQSHGQLGSAGPAWGSPSPHVGPPEGNGKGLKVLLLAVGGFVLLAVVGLGVNLFVASLDSESAAKPDTAEPQSRSGKEQLSESTDEPADQPREVDKGIDVGNGVFVQPAPGYTPEHESEAKGEVILYTEDEAGWLYLKVQSYKGGLTGMTALREATSVENQDYMSGFKTGEPVTTQTNNPDIAFMASMPWSATINSDKRGRVKVTGRTTVIQRKDGIESWVRFMTPADRASQELPKREQMLDSILASQ